MRFSSMIRPSASPRAMPAGMIFRLEQQESGDAARQDRRAGRRTCCCAAVMGPEERDGDDSRDDQQLGHIEDTRAHADQQVADEQHPDVGDDHAHDEGVGDLGVLFHELRAGRQPLRHEPAGEDGGRRAAGDAEGEQGDQRTAHARVVGAFRHEDAFHGALAVAVGVLVPPLGLIVRRRARPRCPPHRGARR